MSEETVSGILWWKPEQWEKAKQISSDGDGFVDSYKEWKADAEKAFINCRALGLTVYKVEIDLDELVQWCADQEIPLNGKARSKFVSIKAEEIHE